MLQVRKQAGEAGPTPPSASDTTDQLIAFVSYAREDETFARRLALALDSLNVGISADWLLEPGPDYKQQLDQLILAADVFVLVITPASAGSDECADEISTAEKLGKRIQPVLHRDPPHPSTLPGCVRAPQWAIIRSLPENEIELRKLEASIKTDFALVQMHTFLLQRAEGWRRTQGGLLRGTELTQAEAWLPLAADTRRLPNPTSLQSEFILASRKRRARTYQIIFGIAMVVAAAISVTAWVAWQNAGRAQREAARATAAGLAAQSRDLITRAPRNLPHATLLALEAIQRDASLEADAALRTAVELLPARRGEVAFEKPVFALDVSRDGRLVAAGGDDSRFHVWRINDLHTPILQGQHDGAVNFVAFSPDAAYLATASRNEFSFGDSPPDNTARIWSLASGKLLLRIAMDDGVSTVKFSRDGRLAAIAPRVGATRIWRLAPLTELPPIPGTIVNAIDFSPDGRRLAVTSNYDVEVWDLETHRRTARLPHHGAVAEVVFSPDGQLVATAARDFKIRIWNIAQLDASEAAERTEAAGIPVRGLPEGVTFSPSGRYIATRHTIDFSVRVWAIEQTAVGMYLREVNRIRAEQGLNSAEFGSDDGRILTAGADGTGRVWDTFTGRELSRAYHDASVARIRTPDDGRTFVTSSLDGRVRVWESSISLLATAVGARPAWQPEPMYGAAETVEFVASSKSQRHHHLLASVSGIQLWESQPVPRLLRTIRKNDQSRLLMVDFWGERSAVVVTDRDIEFLTWTDDPVGPISLERCCQGSARGAATISSVGRLAGVAAGQVVEIWDLQKRDRATTKQFGSEVIALEFDPSGAALAVGERQRASVWSWSDGGVREIADTAYEVAISDDGRLAVTDSESASVWDYQAAIPVRLARLPFDNPTSVIFGPSRLLVIAGGDANATAPSFPVAVWNWSAGQTREQSRIELSRPGRRVARAGQDAVIVAMVSGGARIVTLTIASLREAACGRLLANLTDAEWQAYLPLPRQRTCPNLS